MDFPCLKVSKTYVIVFVDGRTHRPAAALECAWRSLFADHRARGLGAALRRRRRPRRPCGGGGRDARVDDAARTRGAAGGTAGGGRARGPGVSHALSWGTPGDGPPATFFCGAYRFEGDLCQSL